MARFLLVHGAWLGGWSFGPLTRELERLGQTVDCPDLPCEDVTMTAADYAAQLGDTRDAVVVAHSLGGLSASLVPAREHVYVAALLPVPGVFGDALEPGFAGTQRDELDRSFWPDLETAARRLMPDCTREQVEWAFPRLRRQSRIAVVPADVTGTYVACSRDAVVRPDWQRATATALGLAVLDCASGHFPMLTGPRALAELLIGVSDRTPT